MIGYDPQRFPSPLSSRLSTVRTAWVQRALIAAGFDLRVDAIAGPMTMTALREFALRSGVSFGFTRSYGDTPAYVDIERPLETKLAQQTPRAAAPSPAPTPEPEPVYGGAAEDSGVPVTSGGSYMPPASPPVVHDGPRLASRISPILSVGLGLLAGAVIAGATR